MTKIIADACCNHLGDDSIIEKMIVDAEKIGIDFIKFQVFNADALNPTFPDYDRAREYYKKMQLKKDQIRNIVNLCEFMKIEPMFTVFDYDMISFLNDDLGVKYFKIASSDADNSRILNRLVDIVRMGDRARLFVSTGFFTDSQIRDLVDFVLIEKCSTEKKVNFMYCISKYPTNFEEVDFDKMCLFDGFSDHTETIDAAKKAIELDVGFVERHYTIGKGLPGRDHKISSTVEEFEKLVNYRSYIENRLLYKYRWI